MTVWRSCVFALCSFTLVASMTVRRSKIDLSKAPRKDLVVAMMRSQTFSKLHKAAVKAANYLSKEAGDLGSPALSVVAENVAEIAKSGDNTGVKYKEIRGLLTRLQKSGNLQTFCTKELQTTGDRFAVLSKKAKKQDTEMNRMVTRADQLSKEVNSLHKTIAVIKKQMADDSKHREQNHAHYEKKMDSYKRREAELNKTHVALTLATAAAETKRGNAMAEILMHRMSEQSKESDEVIESAKKQRQFTEKLKFQNEESQRSEKGVAMLKTLLIKKAQENMGVQGDFQELEHYKALVDKKCNQASTSHAEHKAEVTALQTTLKMLTVY